MRYIFGFAITVAAVAGSASIGTATTVPGGGPAPSDCYSVFDVQDAATPRGSKVECTDGDPCDTVGACNVDRKCTFKVRLCLNQAGVGSCKPSDVKKLVGGGPLRKPATPATSATCGDYANIMLPLKGNRARMARKSIHLVAFSSTGSPKKDVDNLVLVCKARAQGNICTTTTTSTTTTTIPAACGDGIVTSPEICDRSGNVGCAVMQQCNSTCARCDTIAQCQCGTPDPPTQLKFTTGNPSGQGTCGPLNAGICGGLKDDSGANITDAGTGYFNGAFPGLCCGGLYFGGGFDGVPLPAVVPDLGTNFLKVNQCLGDGTTMSVGATTSAETGSNRTCTKAGCLFGPPLPIPNTSVGGTSTSTCVVNIVSADAAGEASCSTGAVPNLDLPLSSGIYLTGDWLDGSNPSGDRPAVPGIQPCPICTAGTCKGGPNHGLACTPGASALGAAYPTSQDCPPPPLQYLGSLPIGFKLSTETKTATATDLTDQPNVFCGFCARLPNSPIFEGPPAVPCTSNAGCTTAPFTHCEQKHGGAFGTDPTLLRTARTITETGTPAGSLTDRMVHNSTLVSVFCIPPTFDPIVDPSADLPGPGAVALQGQSQLLP